MIISIQFIRFIAALFIVFMHSLLEYGNALRIGDFGVDIFFILSGFIISYITESDRHKFLTKRLIRIVPIYWLFTFVISFSALLFPELFRTISWDALHTLKSLFFFPGSEAQGYLPIMKLGWTLNIEMLFYILFFLSMKFSHKYRELITSIIIIIIIMTLQKLELDAAYAINFYSSPLFIEFIYGMLLAKIWHRYKPRSSLKACIALASTSIAILILVNNYIQVGEYRFIFYGIPSLIFVYSFLLVEKYFSNLNKRIQRIILWLGEMSYPLYLIHIFLVGLIHRVIFSEIKLWALFLLVLASSLVLSNIVSTVFDRPLRQFFGKFFNTYNKVISN